MRYRKPLMVSKPVAWTAIIIAMPSNVNNNRFISYVLSLLIRIFSHVTFFITSYWSFPLKTGHEKRGNFCFTTVLRLWNTFETWLKQNTHALRYTEPLQKDTIFLYVSDLPITRFKWIFQIQALDNESNALSWAKAFETHVFPLPWGLNSINVLSRQLQRLQARLQI